MPMNKFVGVERSDKTLNNAFVEFDKIEREAKNLSAKLKDMLLVSRLITFAAKLRKESRGTHYRTDFPKMNKNYNQRKVLNNKSPRQKWLFPPPCECTTV